MNVGRQHGRRKAQVAHALLCAPGAAVNRISYVGLPTREAIQALIVGRCLYGLQARMVRGPGGALSVIFAGPTPGARSDDAAAAGTAFCHPDAASPPTLSTVPWWLGQGATQSD